MGYQVYEDVRDRFAGYGVLAYCDYPECDETIDRGLAFKCEIHTIWEEDEPIEVEGCGMFFCVDHRYEYEDHLTFEWRGREHPDWIKWILSDESWETWRSENQGKVEQWAF